VARGSGHRGSVSITRERALEREGRGYIRDDPSPR
jgi:hypothetical protein